MLAAYEGLLPKDSFPFYVLFLQIDPESIDINVHPTKSEIKFEDEKTVYAIVRAAVKKSLGLHNIAPSLDFEGDVNFAPLRAARSDFDTEAFAPAPAYQAPAPEKKTIPAFKTDIFQSWPEPASRPGQPDRRAAPEVEDFQAEPEKNLLSPNNKAMQIHQKYLLVPVKSGIMIVDQQAAQERILFEKFMGALERQTGLSQALLFPEVVQFSPSDVAIVQELTLEFRALGFVYSEFGKNTIMVNGIPAEVPPSREKELFEGLIAQYQQDRGNLVLDKKETIARAMAKRVATRLVSRMTDLEINALVDKLFATQVPNYTPSGQKTLVMMELNQLEALFQKS